MKKQKRILAAMGITMALLVMAGCGKEQPDTVAMDEVSTNETEAQDVSAETVDESSDTIVWTNTYIEKAVRKELQKQEGDITKQEAEEVTELDVECTDEKEKQSYADMSYLTNLKELEIRDPKIDDISFLSELEKLENLCVYSENLTDLSALTGNEKMQRLFIQTYGLADLNALKGMNALLECHITSDVLSDVSGVYELGKLQYLFITSNNLQAVNFDFKNYPVIEKLYVKSDKLTDVTCVSTLIDVPDKSDLHVEFDSPVLSEESMTVWAQTTYDYAAKYGKVFVSSCGENMEEENHMEELLQALIAQYGEPQVGEVEELATPTIDVPTDMKEMTIDFDGQLITMPCTMQDLYNLGYTTDEDMTQKIPAGEKRELEMKKQNIEVTIEVENEGDVEALTPENCTVQSFAYEVPAGLTNRPELFFAKQYIKHDGFAYITWGCYREKMSEEFTGDSSYVERASYNGKVEYYTYRRPISNPNDPNASDNSFTILVGEVLDIYGFKLDAADSKLQKQNP